MHDALVRKRLEHLVAASRTLYRPLDLPDPTKQRTARQLDDFLSYEEYCRRSLAALIHEEDLPADAGPPALGGSLDEPRWRAPDLPPLAEAPAV